MREQDSRMYRVNTYYLAKFVRYYPDACVHYPTHCL